MKTGTLSKIEQLTAGDIFTLTPGGIRFEKLPYKSKEGNCTAKVCGTRDADYQSLSNNFPVYFIQHKTKKHDMGKAEKSVQAEPVQISLFNKPQQ